MEGRQIKRLRWRNTASELEDLERYLLDDLEDFNRCDYCQRIRHSDNSLACAKNDDHYVCEDHKSIEINDDGDRICIICIEARKKKAGEALEALSISLKRNRCHKDVYSNIFIPLMDKIHKEAKKKEEWDV
jgi:hypothetical protein